MSVITGATAVKPVDKARLAGAGTMLGVCLVICLVALLGGNDALAEAIAEGGAPLQMVVVVVSYGLACAVAAAVAHQRSAAAWWVFGAAIVFSLGCVARAEWLFRYPTGTLCGPVDIETIHTAILGEALRPLQLALAGGVLIVLVQLSARRSSR